MDTIQTLLKCTVEDKVVKLPNVQLDRPVYLEVKKKLEMIGGKWKGNKINGFVFEEDPTELLAVLQIGGEINLKKEYQFFATPAPLANYLIEKAEELVDFKAGLRILEPSAGDGALVKAVVKHFPRQRVDCVEVMELNRIKLQGVSGADIVGDDFLDIIETDNMNLLIGQYDLVIANPPFSKNQDIDHIRAMYKCIKPGGVIVTIASTSWMNGSQKKQQDFRNWLSELDAQIEQVPAGQFKESGTNVATTIITIKKEVVTTEFTEETQTITEQKPKENPTVFETEQAEEKSPSEILEEIEESMDAAAGHTKDLKQLVNNTELDMNNFFQQLSETMGETELTFVIKQKKDLITLMVLAGGLTTVSNLSFTGTAEDFDNEEDGFLARLKSPMEKIKGLVSNVDEFEKELDAKAAAAPKKSPSKSKAKEKAAVDPNQGEEEKAAVDPNQGEEEKAAVDPNQVDLEQSIEQVKAEAPAETEEERKAREERETKLATLDAEANAAEEAGDFNKAIEARTKGKELSECPGLYQEKIEELVRKSEEKRVSELTILTKQAELEEADGNFRGAAKTLKAAKEFHTTPEELDGKIKELLQKAMDLEFENL